MSWIELALNYDTLRYVCSYLNVFDLILLAGSHSHLFKQLYDHAKSAGLWDHVPLIKLSHRHDEDQHINRKQRVGWIDALSNLLCQRTKHKWPSRLLYRIDQIAINTDRDPEDEDERSATFQASRQAILIESLPPSCRDDRHNIWSHLLQSSLKHVKRVHVEYCAFYEPKLCPNLMSRALIAEKCEILCVSFDGVAKQKHRGEHRRHAWHIRSELKQRLGAQDGNMTSQLSSSQCRIRQLVVNIGGNMDWDQDDDKWERCSFGLPLPIVIDLRYFHSLESLDCDGNVAVTSTNASEVIPTLRCLQLKDSWDANLWYDLCHSAQFSSLMILSLDRNWTSLCEDALRDLHRLPHLQHLSCGLSYPDQVNHIAACRSLLHLEICCDEGERWINADMGKQLMSMSQLQELCINGDFVEPELISVFDCSPLAYSFPHLRLLDISGMHKHAQAMHTFYSAFLELSNNHAISTLFPVLEQLVIYLPSEDEECEFRYRWDSLILQLLERRGACTPARIFPVLRKLWLSSWQESAHPFEDQLTALANQQSPSFDVSTAGDDFQYLRDHGETWRWQVEHRLLPFS